MENEIDNSKETTEKVVKFFRGRIFSFIRSAEECRFDMEKVVDRELKNILKLDFKKKPKLMIEEIKNKVKEEVKFLKSLTAAKAKPNINKGESLNKAEEYSKTIQKKCSVVEKRSSLIEKNNFKDKLELEKAKIGKAKAGPQEEELKKNLSTKENQVKNKAGKSNTVTSKNTNNLVKVDPGQKYYVVTGGYPDVIAALQKWGYKESPKPDVFDFCWSLKSSGIDYTKLKKTQIVNHFQGNKEFTNKLGLSRNIRSLNLSKNVDVDSFYPRCYDLEDKNELDDFLEAFKYQVCESFLKEFHNGARDIVEEKLQIALSVCEKRILFFNDFQKEKNGKKLLISQKEWSKINEELPSSKGLNGKEEDYCLKIKSILEQLEKFDPQFKMSGFHNIWILKPSGLSRGRGIKCLSNLQDLMNSISYVFNGYVIQKYIENPLIIKKRKFDIRQWVTVTGFSPLNVYIYEEPYIRFSAENYNADNVNNLYSHLTNNSIAKYSKNFDKSEIEGNMWEISVFEQFVNNEFGPESFSKVKRQIWDVVLLSLESCQTKVIHRKNSFEVLGYDFMVDQDLRVWLIEINSSPAMDYSTHITEKIVRNGVSELMDLILGNQSESRTNQVNSAEAKWKLAMKDGAKMY